MNQPWRVLPLGVGLVGLGWGLAQLLQAPLHEDEAIYAAWSLQALRGDLLFWQIPLDKPPLTFYPIAASLALFGRQAWAARLPTLLWTLLLLWALGRLGRHLGQPGWLAPLLALASPLLWAMGASAFTDPAMVALTLLALERGLARQPAQAGFLFALACLAKPTALLLAPLVGLSILGSGLAPALLAAALPLLLAWAWDASRAVPSWWVLGQQAYGTLGQGVGAWQAWLALLGPSVGWLAFPGGMLLLFAREAGTTRRPLARWEGALLLTLLGWLPLHQLLGFQPWERYLLPLVPLLALLLAGRLPLPTFGVPVRGLRRPSPDLARPVRPALGLHPDPAQALSYPPLRSSLLLLLVGLFLLFMPALAQQARLAPHDGRWEGIAAMGARIEALPASATLFYLDAGRPLAWYAAGARASLQWGGPDRASLQARLAESACGPRYLLLRQADATAFEPSGWLTVDRAGSFVLLKETSEVRCVPRD